MNKKEVAKGKNLFDEEKIIDTGIKEPLFIRIPFDEYKKYRKLQEENDKLKQDNYNLDKENQLKFDKIIKENEELKEQNNYYRNDIEILEELLGDE